MRNWDLLKEMQQFQQDIDGILSGFHHNRLAGPAFEPGLGLRHYPKINLRDDEDNLYVEALLPGIDADKIEMNILGDTLTLSGERNDVTDQNRNGRTWHRRERGTGKFLRAIDLPVTIVAEKVKAEYRDGLLRVTLPKAAEAKPQKVKVKVR